MYDSTPNCRATTSSEGHNQSISFGYDRVLNAVDDLGWDRFGETPISLSSIRDGTLIVVPAGEYLYDGTGVSTGSASRVGIRGLGAVGDVTITTERGTAGSRLLNIGGGSFHEVSNLTIDWGPHRDTAGACFRLLQDDGLVVRDLNFEGYTPPSDPPDTGPTSIPSDASRVDEFKLFTQITDPDGIGIVSMNIRGPSHIDGHKGGQGIAIHNYRHKGTIFYENGVWKNVNGDAPVYSSARGKVVMDNMRMVNCAMAAIRMGGESEVRNCSVVIDHDNQHEDNTGEFVSANGILWAGQHKDGDRNHGGLIENCHVQILSNHCGGQALRFNGTGLEVTTRHTTLDVRDNSAIYAIEPGSGYGDYEPTSPYGLTFSDLRVNHIGGIGEFNYGVCDIRGRPNTVFEFVDITSKDTAPGIHFRDSPNSSISGTITVPGEAVTGVDSDGLHIVSGSRDNQDNEDTTNVTERTLTITGAGTGSGKHQYEVVVSGGITGGDYTTESGTLSEDGTALGDGDDGAPAVWGGGTDEVTFEGELLAFRFASGGDNCQVELDGETIETPYTSSSKPQEPDEEPVEEPVEGEPVDDVVLALQAEIQQLNEQLSEMQSAQKAAHDERLEMANRLGELEGNSEGQTFRDRVKSALGF